MTRARALGGAAWSAVELGSRQGIQFLVAIVLARLLTPADFGAVAIVLFFVSLAGGVFQVVFGTALIRKSDVTRDDENSVFWFVLGASVLFAIALWAVGPLLADFYDSPVLAGLAAASGALIALNAVAVVPSALLVRRFRFRQLAVIGAVTSLLSAVAGISAALAGWGAWALLVQQFVAVLLGAAATLWAAGWLPSPAFRWSRLGGVYGFAGWLGAANLSDILFTQGLGPLIGKMFGIGPMGLFLRAQATQALPGSVIGLVFARIMLPLLAERQDDPAGLRRYLLESNQVLMAINVPLMVGLVVTADLVMPVLYGPQWTGAAPILALLALGGIIFPLHLSNIQLLLAVGNSRQVFLIDLAKKAVGLAALLCGGLLFGLPGLAGGLSLMSYLLLGLNMHPVKQAIGLTAREQLSDLVPILLAGGIMGLAVAGLRALLDAPALAELVLAAAAGAAIYLAACHLLGVRSLKALAAAYKTRVVRSL